ncbi:DUF664 domain-containing protein [Nocardioides sp. zg-DK7169]|uniref:mycothiol transferase n=1 Tax=Nocardioides sp. zg-DK7169 TaxID=2736600 RepID=UPI0020A68890|nr:DUF664 domain-containing protein [Nocardioides sp. zg-DK7169]
MAEEVDEEQLRGVTIRDVDLSGTRFIGVEAEALEITGDFGRLEVNGVDVVPLVEAELDRRHPERTRLRPTTVAGYHEAFTVLEQLWADTVTRARRLDPAQLHERVAGEWSFTDTLRHLVFATESWIGRVLQGVPDPWHPLSLPWEQMPPTPGVPSDRDARPRPRGGAGDAALGSGTGPRGPRRAQRRPAHRGPHRPRRPRVAAGGSPGTRHPRPRHRDQRGVVAPPVRRTRPRRPPPQPGAVMTPTDQPPPWEPPYAGSEAEQLLAALERLRTTFRWKADGLDSAGLATGVGASALTLGGLLKHLAAVESTHVPWKMFGDSPGEPWDSHDWDADPDWDFRSAADDAPADLYARYDAAVARSRHLLAAAVAQDGLDQPAHLGEQVGRVVTLRRLVCDLIEEYGRHTGHADLLREAVDGRTGEDPPREWRPWG